MSSSRIRILTIGHSYVVALNRAFLRNAASDPEFEFTVVCPEHFFSELGTIRCEPEPDNSSLNVISIPVVRDRWIHTFGYDRRLAKIVREGQFDIVHAWEEPYIYAGYQIAHAVTQLAPEVAFCFRTAQSLPKHYPPPFSYFERYCLRRADGWIAGAHLVYENCVRRGYPADKGIVLTLAVDTTSFKPLDEAQRELLRAEFGLQAPVLGYLGRLTTAKGIDVMLNALERLEPERPWSLLVLGSGPREQSIRDWVQRRGWANRVRVKSVAHHEVPQILPVVDLLLAPSLTTSGWREQFGRMVIEAFACGVPVIASDSGELPYLLGDSGWVVPEGNATALAIGIKDALDSPETRKNARRRAMERLSDYSAQTVGRNFREYYRALVNRKHTSLHAA
jgi:phosphatidylinositol alpha-1,6-mannosyltransferase